MATALTAGVAVNPVSAATYFVQKLGCTAFPVWGSTAGVCSCGDPHTGRPPAKWGPDNVGKHPATVHGFKDGTTDVDAIKTFLANPGTPNYGLTAPPGVMAIDVDGADGFQRWQELERLYGPLPVTLTTLTANGRHYFFRWPAGAGPMPRGKLFGFVVRRSDDGYVIGPGSVHPSGTVYDTLRQPNGMPYDIADLPERWVAGTERPVLTVVGGGAPPLPEPGGRHDWLRDRARHFRGFIDEPAVLRAALLAENSRLSVPKSEAEVDRAIGDVFAKFPLDPPEVAEERIAHKLGEDDLGLLPARGSAGFPAPIGEAAFRGLLGECVFDIAEGTDASLVGLLGCLVAFCGAMVPGSAWFFGAQTSSPYVALVGETSIGRKTTAMRRVKDAVSTAFEAVYVNRVQVDGLNSGEGLVSYLSKKKESFPHEPTVGLVYEEEYATLLASRGREGSTLDPKMRQAFDGGPMSNRRSNVTTSVLPPYWLPALIAITPDELRTRLEVGAIQSGSANRWLYLAVTKRSTAPTNDEPTFELQRREALIAARRSALDSPRTLSVAPAVTRSLGEYSDYLPEASFGISRDLVRRLPVIALRVALVHALVERAPLITPEYLDRALELTEYGRRSIPWIFGETIGSPDADLLLRWLVDRGRLTKREITQEIIRDLIRRQAAIDELVRLGRAEVATVYPEGKGRPRTELVTTAASGNYVQYVQGLTRIRDDVSPDLHGNDDLSVETPNPAAQKLHGNSTEIARKSGEEAEIAGSTASADPAALWLRPCRQYADHTSRHRLTADGWVCDECDREDGGKPL